MNGLTALAESRIDRTAGLFGCWPWLGRLDPDGYGRFAHTSAHAVVYRAYVGPVPAGLELDHTCRNRACVNPAHLEPVTHRENIIRSRMARTGTHCVNGHPRTPESTYVALGYRVCRVCNAEAQRRRKARLQGAAA